MNDKIPKNQDADLEQLVAYLDGELDADQVRQLEDRLMSDAQFQNQLQKLQRSWDLLDELPREVATESFTKTTVEMVAIKATDDLMAATTAFHRKRTRRQWLGWSVALMVCAGSFWGFRSWLGRHDRQLVEDLPVIENVDMYRTIDDIDFLLSLDQEGLFSDEVDQ